MAVERALRALRHRDHTSASLGDVLTRAGFDETEREEAVERVTELGYIDDARFATARAEALASRGAGDRKIEHDLARHGLGGDERAAALGAIDPEHTRAERIVERRGASPATARLLASRGFAPEVVEAVVAASAADEIG